MNRCARAAAVAAVLALGAPEALGQGWTADVSAGRLVFDPVAASVPTNNLIGALRYEGRRNSWVYGAVAVPLRGEDLLWGSGGAGGRLQRAGRRVATGIDVAGHGFSFRDRLSDRDGSGATLGAVPFVRTSVGLAYVEGRGGWHGQTLSSAGERISRGVVELGVRAGYGGDVRIEGDWRSVHAAEGTYPFAGVTLLYERSPVQLWGQAGRWFADTLDDAAWAVGATVSVAARSSVWVSLRQEAPDPLYWNSPRRSWTIGFSQRLGRLSSPLVPLPRSAGGDVIVRLRASDAPPGAISIAGDFNGWRPVPMHREGQEWTVRLRLTPGVYHYAFTSDGGQWFVPSSAPGRRDDGMGGHVAVLLVS